MARWKQLFPIELCAVSLSLGIYPVMWLLQDMISVGLAELGLLAVIVIGTIRIAYIVMKDRKNWVV